MKTPLLLSTITLLAGAPLGVRGADADLKPAAPVKGAQVVVTPAQGQGQSKATITIDVNGRKDTREVQIGNATSFEIGTNAGVTAGSGTINVQVRKPLKTWLGVATEEVSEEVRAQLPLAEGTGLIVRGAVAEGPAAKAGIEKNDVLIKLDDQILTNAKQLRALIGTKKSGDTVRLTYLRRGREASLDVPLGEHEGGDAAGDPWSLSGLLGRDLSADFNKLTAPLQFQSKAVIVDKDGNVLTTRGKTGVNEVSEQLEKLLREAGVSAEIVGQTKRAISEAGEALEKAAGDMTNTKSQMTKDLQEALQQTRQALEKARKEFENSKAAPKE